MLTSQYVNLYCPLNALMNGQPIMKLFGNVGIEKIPEFVSIQTDAGSTQSLEVNTPPPSTLVMHKKTTPTPKGKSHVCEVTLNDSQESRKESRVENIDQSIKTELKRSFEKMGQKSNDIE